MVKSTGCSSEGSEFKSQEPHGGSIVRSDALFWCIEQLHCTVYVNITINKSLGQREQGLSEKKTCLKAATVYLHLINNKSFKKWGRKGRLNLASHSSHKIQPDFNKISLYWFTS